VTVVVEAKGHSGARMQARLALLHGKRVFLFEDLVTKEPWAREYVARGATIVKSVDDILQVVASSTHPPKQLKLA
jgi:DNA processing protein